MSLKRIRLLARIQFKRAFFMSISISSFYIFIDTIFAMYLNFISARITSWFSIVTPLLISFLFSLVFNVLMVGIHRFFLLQAERKDAGFSNVLYGVKNSPDRIILFSLIQFLITKIPLLPGGICLGIYYFGNCEQEVYVAIGMFLILIGAVISYILTLSFTPGLILAADDTDYSATELCKKSFELMKGNKERLFVLQLGFVPLLIASMIFYIALFLIVPYYLYAVTIFYLDLNKRITPQMYFPE